MKMNSFNFSTTKAAQDFAAAVEKRVEGARAAGLEQAAPLVQAGRSLSHAVG